jgi:thiol-disulfide isomerase/thioredoxin
MEGMMAAKAVTERGVGNRSIAIANASAGRLQGNLVRSMPIDRADCGGAGNPVRGQAEGAEGRCGPEQNLAIRYGIMSIPTLLLFKGGKVVDQIVGALPRHVIEERVRRHLGLVTDSIGAACEDLRSVNETLQEARRRLKAIGEHL